MNELISILTELRPGKNFSAANNFFDEGLLDSLDLTTLVSSLESRYGVFVDVDEMVPETSKASQPFRTFWQTKA